MQREKGEAEVCAKPGMHLMRFTFVSWAATRCEGSDRYYSYEVTATGAIEIGNELVNVIIVAVRWVSGELVQYYPIDCTTC